MLKSKHGQKKHKKNFLKLWSDTKPSITKLKIHVFSIGIIKYHTVCKTTVGTLATGRKLVLMHLQKKISMNHSIRDCNETLHVIPDSDCPL